MECINNNNARPLTVFTAFTFTPDLTPATPTESDTDKSRAYSLNPAPILPNVIVIVCGAGSCTRALDDIFEFTAVTAHDWRAPECARTNGMATYATFKQTSPGDLEYGSFQTRSNHWEHIIRRTSELEQEGPQVSARAVTALVQTFFPLKLNS